MLGACHHVFGRGHSCGGAPRIVASGAMVTVAAAMVLLILNAIVFFLTRCSGLLTKGDLANGVVSSVFLTIAPHSTNFGAFGPNRLTPVSLLLLSLLV